MKQCLYFYKKTHEYRAGFLLETEDIIDARNGGIVEEQDTDTFKHPDPDCDYYLAKVIKNWIPLTDFILRESKEVEKENPQRITSYLSLQ